MLDIIQIRTYHIKSLVRIKSSINQILPLVTNSNQPVKYLNIIYSNQELDFSFRTAIGITPMNDIFIKILKNR